MKKILLFLFLFLSFLNAKDTLVMQQQNVLYVQNMIEIEEKIANNFEKYLLQEFKIPTLEKLKTDDYLGSNFTDTNRFGASITLDGSNLKINYAITNKDTQEYVIGLYKRELYRDMTTAYTVYETTNVNNTPEDIDSSNSYISFELKSKEAENIFAILKTGSSINPKCTPTLINTYCIANSKSIKWYDGDSYWIEYSISDFEDGNITISTAGLLTNSKLDNLKTGSTIFVKDGDKYLKLSSDLSIDIVRID